MMDHSAMGMMADMGQMTEELKGLTGDAFDKAFLASMIEHHKSAKIWHILVRQTQSMTK